jgi:sterol desaturase/sphingolipid hydroxylase (fatty acid hydroxylase superfamily)
VHHAVNDVYIDRNYGGILMVWDRLFGTFVEESEKCVYGTRAPLRSWDPLWANVEVYADLARKSRLARRWRDKVLVWFKPPGWRPIDAPWPASKFDIAEVRTYDPPMSRTMRIVALVLLAAAILATLLLLWYGESLPKTAFVLGAIAVVAVLWSTGAMMQGRLRIRSAP